jgi:hypothetical protein
MTANELADAIEKGGKDGFFQDEIIAILRQQATEIKELKLENKLLRWTLLDIRNMARLTEIPEKAIEK